MSLPCLDNGGPELAARADDDGFRYARAMGLQWGCLGQLVLHCSVCALGNLNHSGCWPVWCMCGATYASSVTVDIKPTMHCTILSFFFVDGRYVHTSKFKGAPRFTSKPRNS